MTRERAKSMDQRSFWRSCTAEAAEETVSAAHGFPGTRQNDSVCTVPRVHPGNVRLKLLLAVPRLIIKVAAHHRSELTIVKGKVLGYGVRGVQVRRGLCARMSRGGNVN